MKRIVTLALLFYAATLCHADVPETLKMVAAHDGFTYDGIRHIQAGTAGYYCFVNGRQGFGFLSASKTTGVK
jgi:hypothetical protein